MSVYPVEHQGGMLRASGGTYYWVDGFLRSSEDFGYSMNETKLSPTIPGINYDNNILELELKPNPVSNDINVQIYVQETETVLISVSDLSGRELLMFQEKLFKGRNYGSYSLSELDSGMYLITITGKNGGRMTKQIIKI